MSVFRSFMARQFGRNQADTVADPPWTLRRLRINNYHLSVPPSRTDLLLGWTTISVRSYFQAALAISAYPIATQSHRVTNRNAHY
ncbi:hypothetical protein chiPu_0001873 [Chiloscyllium punctatum]|uniref:Uncharacterized protein n=1 Tax=Chiloscyllium punctatum TaxID=137246 RepID=A0A401RZ84_CHIPU|nr:hypothetical protein [Chiloscyllium punctatum]